MASRRRSERQRQWKRHQLGQQRSQALLLLQGCVRPTCRVTCPLQHRPIVGGTFVVYPPATCSITRMLEDQTLGLLSCLVVDELHMVGEEERGYQLELLLTKLRWVGG